VTPVAFEFNVALLRRKAVQRRTPVPIRVALCRLLARAREVRADDLEMTVTMCCKETFGDATAADVLAAVRGALFFADWDKRCA
jgi:hypothetical protein